MYRHKKITLWFLFDVVKITDPFAGNTGDSDIKYCSTGTVARVFAETSGITKIRFGTYSERNGGYKIEKDIKSMFQK